MTASTEEPATAPLRLLLRLLQRDDAGVRRCLQSRPDVLDTLAAAAAEGGLSLVLRRALAGRASLPQISGDRLRALDRRCERQAQRYAVLGAGLARIAHAFDAAALPFVLLKGAYLGQRFYGDPAGREFVDLDLLVRRADRRRAGAILDQMGFARRSRILGSEALTAFFVHGFDYAAAGVYVDLHWSLARHPSFRLDESRTWDRTGTFALDGRSYRVPSDEDEVTLQALALLRDIERARPKLKNVVDLVVVVAALDATLPWDDLFARSRSAGTYGPLVNVLSLCLDAAAARDAAPRLATALGKHSARLAPAMDAATLLRLGPAPPALAHRLWAARSHDASLAACLAWWAASLPFRHAVHGVPSPVAAR